LPVTPPLGRHLGLLTDESRARDLQRNMLMTFEIFSMTAQIQRWLNLQIARHLEAQAARLKSARRTAMATYPAALKDLGADGPGGSVGLDCMGMPEDCYHVDETESIDAVPAAHIGMLDSEKHTVRA
jgi:hypothetical protein